MATRERISRSLERGMARVVFMALVVVLELLTSSKPVLCQRTGGRQQVSLGATEASVTAGRSFNLPIPIPTSLWFYEGRDLEVDSCPRDQVVVNGSCHRLLTQGPCQTSDFVLLDPSTLKGYCAPRLCAPDRIFVFSDQLCHDPFSSRHCPGEQELYQTAFGTPICQCPDGFLEAPLGRCMAPLTPSSACLPGQVLWTNTSRSVQVCGPDPCGRLNLDRAFPSTPFVPSLADGTCHQLGQGRGVCSRGTFYSLNLEKLGGVCSPLEAAGYITLDDSKKRLFTQLYGPFTSLDQAYLKAAPLPNWPQTKGHAELKAGGSRNSVSGAVRLSQQNGQVSHTHAGGAARFQGLGGGGGAPETKLAGVTLSGGGGQEAVPLTPEPWLWSQRGAGQASKRPHHPSNHYLRGHSLGPVRQYKFDALSKHFMPTRLDLTQLHVARSHNHLVRPRPAKPIRLAAPPVKSEVVPARLLAQTLLAGHHRLPHLDSVQGFLSETREADDDQESSEVLASRAADSHVQDGSTAPQGQAKRFESRYRRAAQSSVVETRLVSCRPGARRHVNTKCRHTLLPFFPLAESRFQASTGALRRKRRRRSVTSLIPGLSCPENSSISVRRQCDITSLAITSYTSLLA